MESNHSLLSISLMAVDIVPVVRGTEQAVSPTHLATELFSFAVMGCGGGGDHPLGLQCSLE